MGKDVREEVERYQTWLQAHKMADRWSLKRLEFGLSLIVPTYLRNDGLLPALPCEVEIEEQEMLEVSRSLGRWSASREERTDGVQVESRRRGVQEALV